MCWVLSPRSFRTSVFDRLGSPTTTTQRTVTQEPPFRAGPGRGDRHRPYSNVRKKSARLLRLPQPDNVDGSQVGARLADFAPHWQSLLGNCQATGIVEDGALHSSNGLSSPINASASGPETAGRISSKSSMPC